MLDVIVAHHEALCSNLSRSERADTENQRILRLAGSFLAEYLSPFEMAQRGFQETISALKSLNEGLASEVEERTRALSESEERYRTLIQISPDGITATDLQGRIILSSQQAALLHGYQTPEEEEGVLAGNFVAAEDMQRVKDMARRVLESGETQDLEYVLVRKDGARIPVEARVTLMVDLEGKPTGFMGVVRDITRRKEDELRFEIQAARQVAIKDLSQLALAETGIEELMSLAVELVTRTLNVEFCELLEMIPGGDSLLLRDGVGWKDGSIGVVSVRADDNSQAGFTLLSSRPVVVRDLARETRFTPPKLLTDHGVVSGITVIIHSDGQPYGILGAHTARRRDFTTDEIHFLQAVANTIAMAIKNRRLLESEAGRREKAERSSEDRLKALAVVAHELRTPLTSIKGFATTMLAPDVSWSAESQRDFIQTIDEEADKLGNLIGRLLDISKMEAGGLVIAPVDQPLSAIIDRGMAQLRALTSRHELVIEIPDDLPLLRADSQGVGQVLTNLVENAVKYSPPHTRIVLSVEAADGFARISVADQGQGIRQEDMLKVFQPFYRAASQAASKSKGSGLGMYICRRLVEAQGGRIWIEEHEGPGTVVVFTLPFAGNSSGKAS